MKRAIAIVTASALLTGCAAKREAVVAEEKRQEAPAAAAAQPALGGLQITDTQVGTGAEAVAGKTVSVHYTGRLLQGRKFDSSLDRGQPFSFQLGAGQVIQGWDQGFAGMREGGKRTLVIPPHMGYGASGAGGVIPPNATLVFDVELLKVQ